MRREGRIDFEILCPKGIRVGPVSTDAELFQQIRNRSRLDLTQAPQQDQSWSNLLAITNSCNAHCPVCFAAAGEEETPQFLSREHIAKLGRRLRVLGRHKITLTGGEPTLHPQLPEVIRDLRRLGLLVTMPTNGIRLGNDPAFARSLQKAGLGYVYIQLDSLDERTHACLRGAMPLQTKFKALEHCRAAGLRFGIIATVIRDNLGDMGKLVQFAAGYAPDLSLVVFQSAAPVGRFEVKRDAIVDREQMIRSLLDSGVVVGLNSDDVWPVPRYAALGVETHPDCCALIPLAVWGARLEPLGKVVDIGRLVRLLADSRIAPGFWGGHAGFAAYALRSIRPGQGREFLAMARGLITRRGTRSMMMVAMDHFMSDQFVDNQKIAHCAARVVCPDGSLVPTCVFHGLRR